MKWRDLTSTELAGLDRSVPVFMNVAAIEQHGPHLPLATDAVIGQHFLDRLEQALSERVLVLPQMQVGCSAHHLDFSGTLSIRHDTFLAYVGDIVTCVHGWGFSNIVLMNSHGGNQAIGKVLLERLGPELKGANLVLATWWHLAASRIEALGETGALGIGHACEFETSLMMHIDPTSVRAPIPDGLSYQHQYDWADGGMIRSAAASLYRSVAELSGGSGVLGAPWASSAAKGARLSDEVLAALTALALSLQSGTLSPTASVGTIGPV